MKSYTLTQISGTDFTVSLNGTPLTVTEFENVFYSAGEAQLISDANASGVTLWDSDQKDGNSISSTAEITSATAYNATWDEIESGATSNVFTSVEEADGIGLTKFQLSELMGKIKEGQVKVIPEGTPYFDIVANESGVYKIHQSVPIMGYINPNAPSSLIADYRVNQIPDSSLIEAGADGYNILITGPLIVRPATRSFRSFFMEGFQNYRVDTPGDRNYGVAFGRAGTYSTDFYISFVKDTLQSGGTSAGSSNLMRLLTCASVSDVLTSNSAVNPLSANQGKVLNETKLSVANLLAGSGVTLTAAGSGANQTVTIDADTAPAFTTNEWNALWS